MKNDIQEENVNNYCSGCSACVVICPQKALKWIVKDDGFWYPSVDLQKCINCGLCKKVCPHFKKKEDVKISTAYLYNSKDKDTALRSSSGGAFYELAKNCLKNGGYVCGCIFDKSLKAKHIVTNKLEDIQKMQGSKYVQSDMQDCFREILQLIKSRKRVLFSGTPCQCVAIHNYIEACGESEGLVTVSLICHGVPSPALWENYKLWFEKKSNYKIIAINFRDKRKGGYGKPFCRYNVYNQSTLEQSTFEQSTFKQDLYMLSFIYNLALRESCFDCDCKGIVGDIMVGDWYEDCYGEGKWGTSCILCGTKKGLKMVEENLNDLKMISVQEVKVKNPYAFISTKRFKTRKNIMENIHDVELFDHLYAYLPYRFILKKIFKGIGLYRITKKIKDFLRIV